MAAVDVSINQSIFAQQHVFWAQSCSLCGYTQAGLPTGQHSSTISHVFYEFILDGDEEAGVRHGPNEPWVRPLRDMPTTAAENSCSVAQQLNSSPLPLTLQLTQCGPAVTVPLLWKHYMTDCYHRQMSAYELCFYCQNHHTFSYSSLNLQALPQFTLVFKHSNIQW